MKRRCEWRGSDPLYVAYHDDEWGVPVHDDRCLFEMLTLGGAQAGLSWLTILKKREGYRKAFHSFDYDKIASYSQRDIKRLLADSGIVRNRLKIESVNQERTGCPGHKRGVRGTELFSLAICRWYSSAECLEIHGGSARTYRAIRCDEQRS